MANSSLPDNAPHPLRDRWLDIAAANASTKWVKQFIQTYLPQLQQGRLSNDRFAALFEAELGQRNLIEPTQQKNYRSNVVQALKVLDPNHEAIDLIALSTETYRELNDVQRGRMAERETKYFTSAAAQTLVDRATSMLNSNEWSEVAAGLAVLIGRRISEVLLSHFALRSDWSLDFSEMAKKAEGDGLTIEIPTLAPAAVVLRAIDRLQAALRIDDLRLESVTAKGAKQRINSRYSEPVARRCDERFADLIPKRTDRENLYTHVFRGVYATIASHWFCPPTVPEHSFKAEIQGHFTISSSGQKLPNFSARANYDDYAIGSTNGSNRDGRLGIKLGQLPGLQTIEAFRKPSDTQEMQPMEETAVTSVTVESLVIEPQIEAAAGEMNTIAAHNTPTPQPTPATPEEPAMNKSAQKRRTTRPHLYPDDLNEMTAMMKQRGITGGMADVFHALIEAFQQQGKAQQQQQVEGFGEMGKALNRFLDKIQALELTVRELEAERDSAKRDEVVRLLANQEQLSELQLLQAENQQLRSQLQQVQAELNDPRKMLERVLAQSAAATAPTEPANSIAPAAHSNIAPASSPAQKPAKETRFREAPSKPSSEPKSRSLDETKQKIGQIIDAIVCWNQSQPTSSTMLAISIPAIKGIATAIGAGYQKAIQEVLAEREDELKDLGDHWMLGSRHNATVRGKDEILKSIARENMGLENWENVKFA
jgi:hypothetical protein